MSRCFLLTLLFAFLSATRSGAEETLAVLPKSFQLMFPGAQQQLVLEKRGELDRFLGQVHDGISWKSNNPDVVAMEGDRARAVGDGETTIEATWQGKQATATVRVSGTTADLNWEFRRHVLPVLAKQGCNSGACHGALAGKGGFKLSLRGYDPLSDHWWITRQARGRRLEPADPARSLLLAKPSGGVPHKGGIRLEVDSENYRLLGKWISDDAPAPTDSDPRLDFVRVLPGAATLRPGDRQQLIVTARYSDGREEDVTQWAKFSSTNAAVATLRRTGRVEGQSRPKSDLPSRSLPRSCLEHLTHVQLIYCPAGRVDACPGEKLTDGLGTEIRCTIVGQRPSELAEGSSSIGADHCFRHGVSRGYQDFNGRIVGVSSLGGKALEISIGELGPQEIFE